MARIFITGSSDGLGQIAARALISQGHEVTLHARNAERAAQAQQAAPGSKDCLIADLSSASQTKALAEEANKKGRFDVVMHNAALGLQTSNAKNEDGIAKIFAVNSLAPYILTCLMNRPKKLVYVSSELHANGDSSLNDVGWATGRPYSGMQAYCDTKLHNILLSNAVARRWTEVESNSCTPGWVKTKLGGYGAPGSAERGAETQIYLAKPDNEVGTGGYWANVRQTKPKAAATDVAKQDEFLKICEQLSGVALPK
jgi:NAD(P)-dependent dehydrogenase (short-subunit alcohol dehydrogenase family)